MKGAADISMTPKNMRRGIDFIGWLFKFSRLPLVGDKHPWTRPDKTDMRWLPINADLSLPENSPMPLDLLDRLIEDASHRAVFDHCGCRVAYSCEHYPEDIGCLIMGDSALEALGKSSHEAGVEEAKALARKAVDAGLVPVVGKARVDNFLFGVKDRGRMLTVCFCCECCCITRFTGEMPLKVLEPMFPRLSGISMTVGEECKGCGKCVEHCYIKAISLVDKRAVISDYCRACGRCATVCPNDVIEIRIDDPDFLDDALERIRAHVKYD